MTRKYCNENDSRIFRRHSGRHRTLLGLLGCSGMSPRERDTAVGAGVGAVAGSVLTGGSAIGTVGAAAVGGVVGNEVGKDKK